MNCTIFDVLKIIRISKVEEEEVIRSLFPYVQIIFSYKNPHNDNNKIILAENSSYIATIRHYNHDNAQSAKTRLFALCEYN